MGNRFWVRVVIACVSAYSNRTTTLLWNHLDSDYSYGRQHASLSEIHHPMIYSGIGLSGFVTANRIFSLISKKAESSEWSSMAGKIQISRIPQLMDMWENAINDVQHQAQNSRECRHRISRAFANALPSSICNSRQTSTDLFDSLMQGMAYV